MLVTEWLRAWSVHRAGHVFLKSCYEKVLQGLNCLGYKFSIPTRQCALGQIIQKKIN